MTSQTPRTAPFQFALDPTSPHTLVTQITQTIIARIQDGTYPTGMKLPGSRTLAVTLGVHRSTVLSAYDDLISQGWLRSKRGSGTFVHADVHDYAATPKPKRSTLPTPPALRSLTEASSGLPDPRLIPKDDLARTFRRVMRLHGTHLLDRADPRGDLQLRKALCTMLRTWRSIHATPDNILITRGSQMAISLAAHLTLQPNDRVAVAHLGYTPAWSALRSAGGDLVGVDVDRDGLCVERIPDDVRVVYTTPHHQYPTTATMSAQRRLMLLEHMRRTGAWILEDDYDFEFRFSGRPVNPMASLVDRSQRVLYVGTLSKVLGTGLRVGYIVASSDVIARMAERRILWDGGGGGVVERVAAEWIEDGDLMRHIARMRKILLQRRDAMHRALQTHAHDVMVPRQASGGMASWVAIHTPLRHPTAWSASLADAHAVRVHTHAFYSLDSDAPYGPPHIRLGFAAFNPTEIEHIVQSIASSLRAHTA